MDEKIKTEKQFLFDSEELILKLLKNYMNTNACKLDAFTKAKINGLVTRVVSQEVEYLYEDPENYFEIYGQDHLNN